MEHSTFTPTGLGGTTDDEGMTPLSRLIPHDSSASGGGMSHSEQPPRMSSGQGAGGVPPMNPPMQTRDPIAHQGNTGGGQDSGDIVDEILHDIERGASVQTQPTQFKKEQDSRPSVHFEEPPKHNYNQETEEPAAMLRPVSMASFPSQDVPGVDADDDDAISDKESESGFLNSNFVGTILKETRLPLIVAALIFVAGLSNADDILSRIVPALFQNGNNGYASLIVKAIAGGLIFYAVRRIFL
jgi:hypothetical protein